MVVKTEIENIAQFIRSHPLTRDSQVASWLRFIDWQVRSRLQRETIVPWICGQRLVVRRGMTGATGNIYAGLHEFPDMMLVLHMLRPEDLFLDVGANIGSYTVLASGACGARTFAFEPDPETVRYLRRNVEINGLEERVVIQEVALGPTEKEVSFTIGRDTMNRVDPIATTGIRKVLQKPLDELIVGEKPVMMKIDVEGYEEHVLGGATRLIEEPSLKIIEIETVSPSIETLLKSAGYEEMCYDPFTRKLVRPGIITAVSNKFFIRDKEMVTARLAEARSITVLGHEI